MSKFSEMLKQLRLKKGVTLREFCFENGFDPGNYSRLERGRFGPPSTEHLEKYALALGIGRGTDEWLELFDLAAACRGELPADLLNDEEVVEKLPVLFRTLRAKAISPDQLDAFVEQIRKS